MAGGAAPSTCARRCAVIESVDDVCVPTLARVMYRLYTGTAVSTSGECCVCGHDETGGDTSRRQK